MDQHNNITITFTLDCCKGLSGSATFLVSQTRFHNATYTNSLITNTQLPKKTLNYLHISYRTKDNEKKNLRENLITQT